MKTLRQVLPLILLAGLACSREAAGEVKLIANPSVRADSASPQEIRKIFLEQTNTLGDGSHVEPVLETEGPIHAEFLREYLERTDDDLQNYYRALVFTGRGSMPKALGSDAAVVAYVARTRGAIGYVDAGSATEGVKTLTVMDASKIGQRKLMTRIEPEYPETLKAMKIGGSVRLLVTISAKGNVETVEVLGGNPILGEAAQAAVRQWIYAPSHAASTTEVMVPFDPSK
jgi:TonB family protein